MKKPILPSLIFLGFMLFISSLDLKAQNIPIIGKCTSFKVEGNQVLFSCENDIQLKLKLCSSGVVKLDYELANRKAPKSFAVISDSLENIGTIHVSEQSQSYEIFTSELIIRINKDPFQIRFFDKYQKLLFEDYQAKGFVKNGKQIASYKTLKPDEQFYGLGEKSGPINRRGHSYKMWNSDKPCYGINEDPLYKSIPFFISSYNYGVFFDNTYKTEFKFGTESNQYYSFEAAGGNLVYYFIYGPSAKQVIARYVQLTGKPIMPPVWAFGFAQCRGMLTSEQLSREIASGYRKRQIPCDIIYQDIGWTQNLQDFEWRKENYQQPKAMLADLAKDGFKVIVSQDPVISQVNKKQWREADSLGLFALDVRTNKSYDMPWPWGGNCGVVDFTLPKTADWWGKYQQKVLDDGVRGFWTDMGEPAWSNEESSERLNMKHHLGMHDEIHNVYGLTWDKVVTEQFEKRNPNRRVFQMTRAAYSGLQRYTFGWSGDSGNGDDVSKGWNKLANQIQVGTSAGLGLIPFWTSDISGYCGDIKDYEAMTELYVRWLQFGLFNPLSRIHHEGNNAVEPWLFGSEAEKICKSAIELKYKLHPYIYTYAREAYDTGLPLMRAQFLEYPEDAESSNMEGQFFFGKELLVAPVVEKEASFKKVYLPEGQWIDFKDGRTLYQGKQWISYPVNLGTIPIFVKRGSIIPQMPVQQYIGEKKNAPVWFDVYPAAEGRSASFSLYEDDGESNDYKKDVYSKTLVKCTTTKEGFKINLQAKHENGHKREMARNFGINIYMDKAPSSIVLNNAKCKQIASDKLEKSWFDVSDKANWTWDKNAKRCTIKFQDTDLTIEINIQ